MHMRRGRSRHQNGYVELTPAGSWKAHWFPYITNPNTGKDKRTHKSQIVGKKATMKKFEAEEKLRAIVERINPLTARAATRKDPRTTCEWFIENRWKPLYLGNWGKGTERRHNQLIRLINDQFGAQPISEIDNVALQGFLTNLSKEYSRSIVWGVRSFLRSVFSEAVEQDFILKDPAKKIKRPITRKPDATVFPWTTMQTILAALPEKWRLFVKTGCAEGVRPGELAAFRWRCLKELPNGRRVLEVQETVFEGELRPWAKTKSSEDYIALPKRLAEEILEWRGRSPYTEDDDFIFTNTRGGWVNIPDFYKYVLYPLRETLGLPKINFQIMRRSLATNAYSEKKGNLKDIQKQLRHAKPITTLDNYIKEVPDSVFDMVDSIYEAIDPLPDTSALEQTAPASERIQ
jgi:integrase